MLYIIKLNLISIHQWQKKHYGIWKENKIFIDSVFIGIFIFLVLQYFQDNLQRHKGNRKDHL